MKNDIVLEMVDAKVEEKISTMQDEKQILKMRNLASFLKRVHLDDDFRKDMQITFQNIRKDVGVVEKIIEN